MTMNEALTFVLAWIGGAGLGAIFFGGLWWTVQRGVSSTQPALWFVGSLLFRMTVAMCGFYFVSNGHWDRLLSCLLGFFMANLTVTWLTRVPAGNKTRPVAEAADAP